jgi:DNA repair protein RadD
MQLRPYQGDAVDAVWSYLFSNPGNPVVCMPTGSGKTPTICETSRRAIHQYGASGVVVLSHVKELVEQVSKTMEAFGLDASIYSAGLKQRSTEGKVVCASIQSVFKKAAEFGPRKLVIIDECHRVSKESQSMYGQFLSELATINERLRVVGFSATPYRLDSGPICSKSGLFSHICYEAKIPDLIEQGYLCPLTNRPTQVNFDTSGVKIRGGEFVESDLQAIYEDNALTFAACEEIAQACADRKKVIVFCTGVDHARMVAKVIGSLTGEIAETITGDTLPLERDGIIRNFRDGDLRWLTNCDVLTTGFDAPNIDCVAVLRATMSPGLFAQMAGRGFRLAPSKKNCLLLDYGNNLRRHGPLDAIGYGRESSRAARNNGGPTKICPSCNDDVPAGVKSCPECGFDFPPPEPKYEASADTSSNLLAKAEEFKVVDWHFFRHEKRNDPDAPNTLRVEYQIEGDIGMTIPEWVCFDHPEDSYAFKKALQWWDKHCLVAMAPQEEDRDLIDTVIASQEILTMPDSITAKQDGKFWKIIGRNVVQHKLLNEISLDDVPF